MLSIEYVLKSLLKKRVYTSMETTIGYLLMFGVFLLADIALVFGFKASIDVRCYVCIFMMEFVLLKKMLGCIHSPLLI